jgi:hypothetical protein
VEKRKLLKSDLKWKPFLLEKSLNYWITPFQFVHRKKLTPSSFLLLALKHKSNLKELFRIDDVKTVLGKSIGAIWAIKLLTERSHVSKSLGNTAEAKLALLQVITRVVDQGSRLPAVRFAKRHTVVGGSVDSGYRHEKTV